MADGPGPPVQSEFEFLMNDELESDQGQPPLSPVVCPSLQPVLDAYPTMAGDGENLHREADGTEGEPHENKFLDSPVHGFNPPRELEAGRDRLHTREGRTKKEYPLQSETNDGKAEVQLNTNIHAVFLLLFQEQLSNCICACELFADFCVCHPGRVFIVCFPFQLVLHSQGWCVEMTDGGTTMW